LPALLTHNPSIFEKLLGHYKAQMASQTVSLLAHQLKYNAQCVKVTSMKKIIIPPRSEMEIMAYVHSKEMGT